MIAQANKPVFGLSSCCFTHAKVQVAPRGYSRLSMSAVLNRRASVVDHGGALSG